MWSVEYPFIDITHDLLGSHLWRGNLREIRKWQWTPSDGEAPELERCGVWSTPSLLLLVIFRTPIYAERLSVATRLSRRTMTYVVHSISFQTFFVQAFKIVVDSWTFSILLLYISWDDWLSFMILGSNEQLQQQLEYTLLNPDCQSCWISKM